MGAMEHPAPARNPEEGREVRSSLEFHTDIEPVAAVTNSGKPFIARRAAYTASTSAESVTFEVALIGHGKASFAYSTANGEPSPRLRWPETQAPPPPAWFVVAAQELIRDHAAREVAA